MGRSGLSFRCSPSCRKAAVLAMAIAMLLAATVVGTTAEPCRAQTAITFSVPELRSLPAVTGGYGILRNGEPHPYTESTYTGVALDILLEQELELADGASRVVIHAADGCSVELSLSQVRRDYPGNLKVILAYDRWGVPLGDDEGPVRLVVPQSTPGAFEQGGEINASMCLKWVRTIEVRPVPPGTQAPAVESIPTDSIAVYGAVSRPETASPEAPPPAVEPAAQPEPQPAATPEAAAVPAETENAGAHPERTTAMSSCRGLPWLLQLLMSPWPVAQFILANVSYEACAVQP